MRTEPYFNAATLAAFCTEAFSYQQYNAISLFELALDRFGVEGFKFLFHKCSEHITLLEILSLRHHDNVKSLVNNIFEFPPLLFAFFAKATANEVADFFAADPSLAAEFMDGVKALEQKIQLGSDPSDPNHTPLAQVAPYFFFCYNLSLNLPLETFKRFLNTSTAPLFRKSIFITFAVTLQQLGKKTGNFIVNSPINHSVFHSRCFCSID